MNSAPLPRPIAPFAPSTTTCLISREANKSADLPLAAVVVDNILSPFCASAVYKLTSRKQPIWLEDPQASTEAQQKRVFTVFLQAPLSPYFGQLSEITTLCVVAAKLEGSHAFEQSLRRAIASVVARGQAPTMPLLEQIDRDLKKAMLARDEVSRDTLRMLKTELLTLDDPDEIAVLSRAVKSRRDSIESYLEGGREDLAEKERAEIEVIQRYLPKPLSDDEAREAIAAIIEELGAESKRDLGKVMKEIRARFPGRLDGKVASGIAGELLGSA